MKEADGPGGDFSSTFRAGPDHLIVLVGDVTGHGPSAARFRMELVARAEQLALARERPASLLAKLNAAIEPLWPADVFACVVCIDIDLRRRSAAVAVAGHLPPIVKTRRGARALPVVVGPPIGVFRGERYVETQLVLEQDAVLVVATDGISDAMMTSLDPLGLRALERSVQRGPRDPDDLCAFVFGTTSPVRLKDDATVLAVKFPAPRSIAAPMRRAATSHVAAA